MLFNKYVKIVHFDEPTLSKGRVTPKRFTGTTIVMASVQPVSGKQLEQFPEGERQHIRYTVYFKQPLLDIKNNDEVVIDQIRYKVFWNAPWHDAPFLTHTHIYIGEHNE